MRRKLLACRALRMLSKWILASHLWRKLLFCLFFHALQGTFQKWACGKNLLRKLLFWSFFRVVETLKKYVLFQDGFGKLTSYYALYVTVREGILFISLMASLLVPIFITQGPHRVKRFLLGWRWLGWIWLIPCEGSSTQAFLSLRLFPCVPLLLHIVLPFSSKVCTRIYQWLPGSDLGKSSASTSLAAASHSDISYSISFQR